MMEIIGRKNEVEILTDAIESDRSELVAVYGRRRVGKTFLIREFYKSRIQFEVTGLHKGALSDQLKNFMSGFRTGKKPDTPKNWLNAFHLLGQYINGLKGKRKKVIFIDEFPWMATQRSKFLMAFENFWNSYATRRTDLIVVICGSAASYMVQKIIRNRGGLYNRISQTIRLLPFNLHETELYLKSRGISYAQYDILQLYMAIGGIPHYLEKIKKGDSVAQSIDKLCFSKNGILKDEFNKLFASLFDDSAKHLKIVRTLASVKKGITRKTLISKSRIKGGGDLSRKLDELKESGFITESSHYQNRNKQALYRLSDEYSLFYLKFIEDNKHNGNGTWQNLYTSRSYTSWSGFSFETLCLKHIQQIKKGLGIYSIYSINSSWFNNNAQVDLLIDRDDNIINICELKFSRTPFAITKSYHDNLRNKINEFIFETKTRKNVFLTMITTFGVKQNSHSLQTMQKQLTMECLFEVEN